MQTVTTDPKGVLDPTVAARKFRLARYEPAADLKGIVEHHWVVQWNLDGQQPHVQKTLPYPCAHLVFDSGKTAIFGVMRKPFEYKLMGVGRVLGVRFRPGAFRALLNAPLKTITDRTVSLYEIFGISAASAEASVFAASDDSGLVAAAESIVRRKIERVAPDPNVESVGNVIDRIASDRTITQVEALARAVGIPVRALQRLFSDYVGVSPKWVIRRSRLHDAASRLAGVETVNLTQLAHDLGYADQAHFTRDFKTVVGRSPSEYRRSAAADPAP